MRKSLHTADYQHFLEELRSVRERSGLTQEQLAAALHEHQTLVSKIERGVRRIDVVELRQWLLVQGVPLAEFAVALEERLKRHAAPRVTRRRAAR